MRLELLQQHAMGKDNKNLGSWLEQVQDVTMQSGRLAEYLEVETGWETAVETVLGSYLEAVCLEDIAAILAHLPRLSDESLTVFATQSNDCQSSKGLAVIAIHKNNNGYCHRIYYHHSNTYP